MNGAASARRPLVVIGCLGIVQILNWGSTFYLPAVLGRQIVADTGWSYSSVIAGLTLAMAVAGASAMRVGRLIERHGGRPVLTVSAVLMSGGLTLVSLATTVPFYLAAWVVLGLAMGAGLYDAAFSTLGRLYGQDARKAISTLTLWGGFASTICWPLTAYLEAHVGWRGACLAYAGLHLAISLPLIRFGIPDLPGTDAPTATVAGPGTAAETPVSPATRLRMFVLLAMILTLGGSLSTLLSVHLLTILQAGGASYAAAVGLGTLIGPSQVAARVFERLFGGRLHPIWIFLISVSLVATGLLLLWSGLGPPAVALVSFGAGNGIWSIARGTLPLALFGARGYAVLMGQLAAPAFIIQSVAPSLGAVLMDLLGAGTTTAVLATAALVNICGVVALGWTARRAIRAWVG